MSAAPRTDCPDCALYTDGRGCWPCEQRRLELLELEERLRQQLLVLPRSLARVGSPELTARAPDRRLRAVAERWTPDRGSTLILGESGYGKTTVVGALWLRLADEARASRDPQHHGWRVHWTTGPALLRARRETRLGSPCDAMHAAMSASVLILDEIGSEGGDAAWLLELSDARYTRGLPTVTTSGSTRQALETRYGTAAIRRLIEPGGTMLDFFGSAR